MKVVAMIPIKLNSERLPNKNLKRFDDGTPLCQLVFNTLSEVKEIDEIYCYCSSPKIKEYLTGRVKFLKRNESLDTFETKRNDFIRAFLNDVDTDILVLSHVTSPFLRADTVKQCINAVKSGRYDSAMAAVKFHEFLWKDGKSFNFDSSNLPRTQDLPKMYKETGSCLVTRADDFMKTGNYVGKKTFFCEVDSIEETDIDYPQDFEIANAIYMYLLPKQGGGDNSSHLR